MIEVIPIGLQDRVLGLRIRGSIDLADLEAVAVAFEDKVKRHGSVRIYAELHDVGGITPAALIEDLRLFLRHFRDVEREVIVADAAWLQLLASAGDLLPGVEIRRFSWLEKDQALQWIND